ncbi:MAG: hypothetical protein M3Y39_16985 [Chloroflexota bacterium]|nr:hypothetical protein [Chloroflexota bacterium]
MFKGRKQLNYSPGLKARYQEEETEDDAIAAQGEMAEALTLVELFPWQWDQVVERNVRGSLLELARLGRIGDIVEGLGEIGVEVEPCVQRGWRVSTPSGPGEVCSLVNEKHRGRWRCSVLLDQAENGRRWRAFDLVEVRVIGGPSSEVGALRSG